MTNKIQKVPPADIRIVGTWTITGGDYPLTRVYRADGTVVQYVAGQIIQPRRFEINGEFLTFFVEQTDGSIFEQKTRFEILDDTLTFYDSPTSKPVFRRLQAAQPAAGANADYAFGSAFAVDSSGGAAQLWTLGCYHEHTHQNLFPVFGSNSTSHLVACLEGTERLRSSCRQTR